MEFGLSSPISRDDHVARSEPFSIYHGGPEIDTGAGQSLFLIEAVADAGCPDPAAELGDFASVSLS
jgi:hypothetical protein